MVQRIGQDHAKTEQQIGEQHAHKQHHITAQVLQNHAGAEPPKKRQCRRQGQGMLAVSMAAEVMPQKLQRRDAHRAGKHQPVDEDHQRHRDDCRHPERVGVPACDIGGQAVTAIVHVDADVFEHRVPQYIAHRRADKGDHHRHGHVVAHQLAPAVAGGPQRADDARLFGDGIGRSNGKHKGHNGNDDVEQHGNHGAVAAQVVTGKDDGLVLILGHKILQGRRFVDDFHKVGGCVLLGAIVRRGGVVLPGVVPGLLFWQGIERLLRDDGHTELDGVEHRVRIILKQAAVIRQGHIAGDGPGLAVCVGHGIAHRDAVVLGIHAVQAHLTGGGRHGTLHQADGVDLGAVRVDAQRAAVFHGGLTVVQVVQGHTCAGDRLKLGAVELLFHAEVAILDVVFLKALVVGGDHAGAGHKEARHKADGGDEQNGDDGVLAHLAAQFAQHAFV